MQNVLIYLFLSLTGANGAIATSYQPSSDQSSESPRSLLSIALGVPKAPSPKEQDRERVNSNVSDPGSPSQLTPIPTLEDYSNHFKTSPKAFKFAISEVLKAIQEERTNNKKALGMDVQSSIQKATQEERINNEKALGTDVQPSIQGARSDIKLQNFDQLNIFIKYIIEAHSKGWLKNEAEMDPSEVGKLLKNALNAFTKAHCPQHAKV